MNRSLGLVVAAAIFLSLPTSVVPSAATGDPSKHPDVAVTGRIFDAGDGAPTVGAHVTAWWIPDDTPGNTVSMIRIGDASTDSVGQYTVTATPTREMRKSAAANGGWLNFYVSAISPSTGMATTMKLSRQIDADGFVEPPPLRRVDHVDFDDHRQWPAPATRRAAVRRPDQAALDEAPSVPVSTAPTADLILTEPTSAEQSASARRSAVYCTFSYSANTESRQSVVEFHNAGNSDAGWDYGETADSDIEGGIQYPGKGWAINGSAHISNTKSVNVGIDYTTGQNNYGRSDFLIRHATITALDGTVGVAGTPCYGYPADLTMGTKIASPYRWVGGAVDNATLPGAEFIGCSSSPQADHRTAYGPGSHFDRTSGNAAKIRAAGDIGPIWVGAQSGFSTSMSLHYRNITGSGIWLCGTNYYPPSAGVIHAQNR